MATFDPPPVPDDFKNFKFSRLIPSLEVDSIDRSIEFYTTKLPFYLSGRDSSNHCWLTLHGSTCPNNRSGLEEGSINIYLRRKGFIAPGKPDAPLKHVEQTGLVYIRVDGSLDHIYDLHRILATKGVEITHSLAVTPWGSTTFGINDLDKNVIRFYRMNSPTSKA
ncbi:hypothetical protein O181_008157 [Austropuccinia psidii MF-1]|uniref:Glyoxalase/fosfomycin resistance/dioxygenase domain-containing protein n=1 Tax=Austropuccinia psidii MF-1 TaxID=1389203 RepID=A0A9Q3BNA4_9BASI|nr:hypothetical protein [Austropuccinia psidii MF-1]